MPRAEFVEAFLEGRIETTIEEVIIINASREYGNPEPQHKAAEAGSIVVSVLISSALVYQTNDPILAFSFAALLGFLCTNRVIRALRG